VNPPEAAESPAPATAMICFDDDNNSLKAVISLDGRELILGETVIDSVKVEGSTNL
jgi:hypothetical protein